LFAQSGVGKVTLPRIGYCHIAVVFLKTPSIAFTGQAGRTAAEHFSTDGKHSFPSQPALAGYQLAKISQLVSDKRPDRPAEGTCGPDWAFHVSTLLL
jgi:hypothetical protein